MKEATMKRGGMNGMTFLAGLTLGSLLTALFTPKSGQETRDSIKHGMQKTKETVNEHAHNMTDKIKDTADKTASKVKATTERARQTASDKADDVTTRTEEL